MRCVGPFADLIKAGNCRASSVSDVCADAKSGAASTARNANVAGKKGNENVFDFMVFWGKQERGKMVPQEESVYSNLKEIF
jgi:hypothetical protein